MKESTAAFSEELSLFQRNTGNVNALKFRTPKKKEHPRIIEFSLLTSEAKGSNKFCKGRQKIVTSLTDVLVVSFSKLRFTVDFISHFHIPYILFVFGHP